MASSNPPALQVSLPSSPNIIIRLDGHAFFLAPAGESTNGGGIETVTVVAYPSGVLSTLPLSRGLDGTAPASASLLSSLPTATTTDGIYASQPSPNESSMNSAQLRSSAMPPANPAHTAPEGRRPGSNLASLDPPLYVGIALGGIAVFAIISALVAWCIRSWCSRRRRKAVAALPWTRQQDNDFNGLGAGSNSNTGWTADSRLMSDAGTTDGGPITRHWDAGDRDVGEPRHSDSYGNVPAFLPQHHTPVQQFFSDGNGQKPMDDDNYPPHSLKPTLRRHLPSHLLDASFSTQGLAPGPDRVGGEHELGTPREEVVTPRYLGLRGDALDLPWTRNNNEPAPPPRSMVERLRRVSKPAQETWDHRGSFRTPARHPADERTEMSEGWAGSITSNLVNAFNAVAANIATFNGDEDRRDTLTPTPSKRGTDRKSTRLNRASDISNRPNILNRHDNYSSSTPWILEELADGTGIVHLRISPSKERPSYSTSSSFYSSDSLSAIPLVASLEPQAARLKPDISHHFRAPPDLRFSEASRQTSYSQQSFISSSTLSSVGPLRLNKRRSSNSQTSVRKDKLSPASHRRPSLLSRLSSASSATSWNSLSSPSASKEVAEVLRARKRTYPKN